ncbi:FAD-binding protein [Acidithiobacillus sp. CV18-2]|uniref:FAD-binding protein n=1 Tax=Igneacidithiobacillus copahuensis TaxID=2724909 RepID=A0AAE2YNQ7_9PROT|nr:FAD-linked oxidase C-terminal domain-containing protein [Igneacidithiobacillus copahuensis]MBU2754628.1 FAD-binding protein [Acidithiobacillus sp. CV18-3]MBU2757210.1 FAD-binding protein [Acidithiobacillus sp. BN09-2]MBU2776779.1 FAD-binding protein [Acidithiobacillus sp. CV18-2]MBU2796473.1 FAD-binding protein [Acidithiobacillus sp. VAN18-2]MBU2799491.1 FAD-binding protein [Acidithiobacillus sp. VAN18-4]UTV80862.1 FAD-binding protein [Acidithiobacillus sp. YTS05]
MSQGAIAGFKASLGAERARDDQYTRELYSRDDTPEARLPAIVLFPHSHEEVQAIVRLAGRHRIPLTARGAGSGNVGGALPVEGGAVLSFECMTQVLEYAPQERLIRVQSGCITGEIDRIASRDGLAYLPDPGSSPYCRIGGNLAMNAGGPHAVKYGVTRDYVLGLRAVTGRGETLETGVRTSKGVVGYDLTRLLVGSEGTLALITEATLRLAPRPAARALLRAAYAQSKDACAAVNRVMQQGFLPSAVEFMDAHALAAVRGMGAANSLPDSSRALLMVEVDGEAADLPRQLELMAVALSGAGLLQIEHGQDEAAIAALWAARKSLSPATKAMAPRKINEDVVVPVPRLCDLLAEIEDIASAERLRIVSFGHAGNGNLHVNFLVDPANPDEMRRAERGLDRLFSSVLALGGTLSGEHGIGSVKRAFVGRELDPVSLHLQRQIKGLFDPLGVLNPGKLFPDD